MAALIAAAKRADYPAEIGLVLSDNASARGLAVAEAEGIATAISDRKALGSRAAFEEDMTRHLEEARIELICLAGFMRLLSAGFVECWHDRLINIHPSLLPAFPGLDTHERALAAGVRLHGCTVHFVRAAMDDGPIIIQGAITVLPGDTAGMLAERLLAVEHAIYPRALEWVASGRARTVDGRVEIDGVAGTAGLLISPAG
jgi:phosphoribosylglycinamide formyltransferase-1